MSFYELIQANKNNPNGEKISRKILSKAPNKIELFKRKPLMYNSRKLLIKEYWNDIEKEYTEANNATNIYNMFSEMLESMPKQAMTDNETLLLFKSALEDTIGKEESKTKNKKYI